MSVCDLVSGYNYAVDAVSIIICTVLLITIRWALFFSADKKFIFLKRSLCFILIGAGSNIVFSAICKHQASDALVYFVRDIYHGCFMSCMYIYITYMLYMLEPGAKIYNGVIRLSRLILGIGLIFDVLSPFTGVGLHNKGALWFDPIVSPYNICYIYLVIILICLLMFFAKRLVKSVRYCLVATEFIVAIIMFGSALENTNNFTSFTYLLPILVVMILIHSKPYDDNTGAMSVRSFESFVENACAEHISVDYLVLSMRMNLDIKIPVEMGKSLTSFWHSYFKEALLFNVDKGVYVLAIPRVKRNGNTTEKMKDLVYKEFPKYYAKYRFQYKIMGLPDMDFIRNSNELKEIINYLSITMEENEVLIVEGELREKISVMRCVKEQLVDIEKKMEMNDPRVLVYCQPIKNTKTGKYDTAEALMRLAIPDHEIIQPSMFIPLAEYYGHIHALSKIMLNKVCKNLRELLDEGYEFQRVSVNFAVSEIRDERFCQEVMEIIKSHGLDYKMIGIELTESQNDSDFKIIRDKIAILKKQGMTIYLDDFGTGYSNLDRILKLGLDVIKYDRSILLVADEDEKASYMVQHFAEAFKQFKYHLLFEGVETPEQEKLCLDCGADYLQGFKFSKPIPINLLREFFEKAQ